MNVYLSPLAGAGWQFLDNNGDPLSGGKLYTYAAGTTTPYSTYTTFAGNIPHTNPIILDSAGRVPGGQIWIQYSPCKFLLRDSTDVLIASWDNLKGLGASPQSCERFNCDGAIVNFTLSNTPYNADAVSVYVDGIYQQRNTYSVAGNVITCSEAPPKTSIVEILYN